MGRVFANGPGDLGSIPGRVIPRTLKMVLDTSLLNTQQYKVRIGVVAIEKGIFGSPRLRSLPLLTYFLYTHTHTHTHTHIYIYIYIILKLNKISSL